MFSIVNTLVKKLFKVSALSLGVVALDPSGFVRAGIDGLVINCEFAHFQNILGFSFTIVVA